MKQTMIRTFALLCLVALFFPGCSKKTEAGAMGSEVWDEMPALTYGVMEYDKLEVLPWNSGRCEATSSDTMAETENGYYMSFGTHYLYYADKVNLGNWVLVCNEPDCEHTYDYPGCNARLACDNFVIRDDRIYYDMTSGFPEFYIGNARMTLLSMAADGTDKKLEYVFDEDAPVNVASYMSQLTSQHWFYNVVEINEDGSYTAHAYQLSENGAEKIATTDDINDWMQVGLLGTGQPYHIHGDRILLHGVLEESMDVWFRFKDDQAERVDLTGLPVKYAYLSGDTLRFFRINDGYYDMNIKTGVEVKLADARMENSQSDIVLPNCVIEATLMGYEMFDLRTEGMTHKMELFDGQQWHSVKLPEELVNAGGQVYVTIKCVTSDSIIFYGRDMENYNTTEITAYYRIDLTKDELELEKIVDLKGR